MYPILLLSVVALGVIIERAVALRASRVFRGRESEMPVGWSGPGDLPEAGEDPVGRLLDAARRDCAGGRETLEAAVESGGKAAVRELERGLALLEIIATVSPLLGLLGTVSGMVRIFSVLGRVATPQYTDLATGISEALYTTVAGLVVAIPALVAHQVFSRRVETFAARLEEIGRRIVATFKGGRA